MSKRILVTVDDDLAAAIDRARGEVPAVEWIRNRLREATGKAPSVQPAPAPTPPVRQASAPRVTAPSGTAVIPDRRSAARAALNDVPRRMVASQRAAEPGDTVLDYDDAQA